MDEQMSGRQANGLNRRSAIGGLILAALALPTASQTGAQRGSVPGGIAGGGVVPVGNGNAEFSLFATRMPGADGDQPTVVGHVRWVDPTWEGGALTLVSTEVSHYGPLDDDPDRPERIVRGLMSANGEGAYPFELIAVDAGPERFGEDTIALTVGAAAPSTPVAATPTDDFAYEVAASPVEGGDLELLTFPGTEVGFSG